MTYQPSRFSREHKKAGSGLGTRLPHVLQLVDMMAHHAVTRLAEAWTVAFLHVASKAIVLSSMRIMPTN